MGSAYFILSTVRDVEKNTAKALEMFNEALNIFVKDGDQYNCGYLHYLKGRTYYWMAASTNTRDNIIKSLDSLEEALTTFILKTIKMNILLREVATD